MRVRGTARRAGFLIALLVPFAGGYVTHGIAGERMEKRVSRAGGGVSNERVEA